MATAASTHHAEPAAPDSPASSTRAIAHRAEHFAPYADQIAREHPEYLASLGMTADDLAAGMAEPGLTPEDCVAAGLMSPAEARYIQGCATREDLTALACSPTEIDSVLAEQQARACASSG